MSDIDPFEREVDLWMKNFAMVGLSRPLPDANSIWVKAKLLQSVAAADRAALPITRMQVAAYVIVAAAWAALVTWKWNVLQAWINSLSPTHIIMQSAGAQAATSISLTFLMALIALASVTIMLAFHTILAEE
ncbi:MAG TPA: hypothetical protein VL284_04305 [Thermoanaerobaculia bacterium]|nr:hypothetical protein [Thermoanaerobaculia bacterium]